MADQITVYNMGSLEGDPGTAENIRLFEEETGVTVNVNEVPWVNLKTSLTTLFRNESAKLDAFMTPTWWLADFVRADWITPLDMSDSHMSKYPDKLRNLVTFDGDAYHVPTYGKWGSFLYDTEYLSENGFDSPPNSWGEILSMGRELDSENKDAFAMAFGSRDVFTFKELVYQTGNKLFNDNNEPAFVDPGTQVFNDLLMPLKNDGLFPTGISNMGLSALGDNFIGGNIAMAHAWTPLGKRTLDSDGWNESRLGSAKPPKGPSSRATFQDCAGVAVSAFSEKQQTAKAFARFMSTKEASKRDMLVEGNPAVVPSVYEDSEVQSQFPQDLLEDMKFNLQQAESEKYLLQPQVDNALSNAVIPALNGDQQPREALQSAADQITQIYQSSGIL